MSNNIEKWTTKRLEYLTVPTGAFYLHERKDWHPTLIRAYEDGTVLIDCGFDLSIKGVKDNKQIQIREFNLTGEGSGTFVDWILETALEQSTGILEAILIYEDSRIWKLSVENGEIDWEEIEL